jgi:hypothetical protein
LLISDRFSEKPLRITHLCDRLHQQNHSIHTEHSNLGNEGFNFLYESESIHNEHSNFDNEGFKFLYESECIHHKRESDAHLHC